VALDERQAQSETIALIAYLQTLGRAVKAEPAKQVRVAPAPAAAPVGGEEGR
jgi:catalase (peroxidase I)